MRLLALAPKADILLLAFLPFGLLSCGPPVANLEDLSTGGCGGGAADTGVILCVESIVPTYLGGLLTPNVDLWQNVCAPGPPPTIEAWADHSGAVTFNAFLAQGASLDYANAQVVITRYTIEYTLWAVQGVPGVAGPAIVTFTPPFETITVPVGASVSRDLALFTTGQKQTFVTTVPYVFDDEYAVNLTYTFYGQILVNGKIHDVMVRGYTNVLMRDYDNC